MSRTINVTQSGAAVRVQESAPVSGLALLALAASVVLLSSAWPLTKAALDAGATPLWFAEGRSVLSGLTLGLVLAARGRLRLPGRADLPALTAIGGLQLAAYFALAHAAVAWVAAGRTAILANTTTIWVVPLSLLFLREKIPVRRWIAAGLGLAGVVVLMNPWAIDWTSPPILIGHAFLLGAALAWSVAIIVTRARPPALSTFELLPWCFVLASVMLLPVVMLAAPRGTLAHGTVGWAALGYIGLIAGPFGTWCLVEATMRLPAMVSSIGFLTTPAISLILANRLLGEPFTPDLLLGAALIMAGVASAAWPQRKGARA